MPKQAPAPSPLPIPDIDSLPSAEYGDAWAEYTAAVTAQLDRLSEWRDEDGRRMSQMAKRRGTIWGRAWQAVTPGLTLAAVHSQESTCSYDIFKKKWQHQPLFMDVLETVTALTVAYIDGKTAAKLAYRREKVIEREWEASEALEKRYSQMLQAPIFETKVADDVVTTSADGRTTIIRKTIITPAKWAFRDTPAMAQAASVLGRRATGMDITGVAPDAGDDGGMELTADDVQQSIMKKLAKMRAGIVGGGDGDDEVVETAVFDEVAIDG